MVGLRCMAGMNSTGQDGRLGRQVPVQEGHAMASEWSPAAGWRSYDTWKRWYRQNWGGLQASPPPAEWRAVFRAFSEPEGIQAELEIAIGRRRPRL
jgi:hypothetical protein